MVSRFRASFAIAVFSLVAFLALASEPATNTERWFGPAPIDEEGRYANPIGELLRGGISVRLAFILHRIPILLRPREGAARLHEHSAESDRLLTSGEPTVTWIGHATLLVEMDGVRFLTDPMWSKRASPLSWAGPARLVAPGIALEDLPPIDFVLISHNHYDHLDLPTLERLAKRNPETTFYVPLGNAALLNGRGITRVVELDWTQKNTFAGVEIHCLPSQHWSKRGVGDDREALWSSWAVIGEERRFYFAGDTGYFSGFAEIGSALGPFDLAAVPIGAYRPTELMRLNHMNPEEAVHAATDVRASTAVAIHFGTFDLSDEPLDEPPDRFRNAAAATSPEALEAWVLAIGETRPF
jgi:N-acyl-phosphatidylethanolamine-hydrolysing phospholipase D